MLYPAHIEQKLGFDRIRQLLTNLCVSALGRIFVEKMRFSDNFSYAEKVLHQTAEFKELWQENPNFPSQNYIDVTQALAKAGIEGAFLTETEFFEIKISLRTIRECLRIFDSQEEGRFLRLKELITQIFSPTKQPANDNVGIVLKLVFEQIDKIIDDRGLLRDNASPELQAIRRELISQQAGLRKKLDTILRQAKAQHWISDDVSLTIRSGRMVIPLAAEHKRKIKGFVHDESDTGKTVFLEPTEVLEANNEIRELEAKERREIIRILTQLTYTIRPLVEPLKKAYTFLGLIDFLRAKARFAVEVNAVIPKFSSQQIIHWQNARHPLLQLSLQKQSKKVVPLSVSLSQENRILVVSGPNAGGKSVMLKTIGLLQYMVQCGLLVPMNADSEVGFFKNLFIDIGDEQNLDNDLSTYSSHLTNMKHFLLHTNKQSLFLIDEFGTGTEPSLGGAIAEAILNDLNKSGGFGVVNTHYTNLKVFADASAGLFNGAMRYDGEHLEPLYELEAGKPGSSFALEIAQKIGLPKPVLDRAKAKLGDKQLSFEKLVKELDIEKKVFAERNTENATLQRKLSQQLEQYTALKNYLEAEKKALLNDAKQKSRQLLKDANARIEQVIREIREQGAEKFATKNIRQGLESFEKEFLNQESTQKTTAPIVTKNTDELTVEVGEIIVGSLVRIIGQPAVGEVLGLKGKNAEVAIGELKTNIKIDRLEKVSRKQYETARGVEKTRPKVSGVDLNEKMMQFTFNVDLRGQRSDEALKAVDLFMDDALMLGYPELRIVHGKGDGILRTLIRNHLRKYYTKVESMNDDHADRGGAGVTIIRIKD